MALVKVENAEVVFITEGWNFKAKAPVKLKNGDTMDQWYTVWTDQVVEKGDQVDIVGNLSTKVEEFTGRDNVPKVTAAIHINDAKVTKSAGAPF
jgi:hypothetical protein